VNDTDDIDSGPSIGDDLVMVFLVAVLFLGLIFMSSYGHWYP
jgi:hypothetical protein